MSANGLEPRPPARPPVDSKRAAGPPRLRPQPWWLLFLGFLLLNVLLTRAFDSVVAQRSGGRAAHRETLVADAAAHVTARAGRLDTRILADRHPFPAIAPATVAQQIGGPELRVERLTGADGMQLIGEFFARANWAAAMRAALEEISRIESLDERRLLLCETLDCCSHRLDGTRPTAL